MVDLNKIEHIDIYPGLTDMRLGIFGLRKKILETYDIVFLFLKDVLEMQPEKAKEEAEQMKTSMSDETINSLARYVHNVLGLNSLDCNYDVNQEKCRKCARRVQK